MALHDLPARAGEGFHVVVESPRGARVKLKYEREHAALFLSRALPLGYKLPVRLRVRPRHLAARVREELAHFSTSSVYFAGKDARALRWRGPREARALVAQGERSAAGR